ELLSTHDPSQSEQHRREAFSIAAALGYRHAPQASPSLDTGLITQQPGLTHDATEILRDVAGALSGLEVEAMSQRLLEALLDETRADRAFLLSRQDGVLCVRAGC